MTDANIAQRLADALGSQYEVRALLGRGGFAEVYEVWDRSLDRRLAVKVLREDVAWTSGMLTRFRQEAKAVAALAHPNILQIHFVGEAQGLVYYAMPFIEGQSLGEALRAGGAMAPERAVGVIRPILEALQHAHEKGLIHRDIKPDNVMLDGATGRPLLVDFGIAKRVDAEGKGLTQTGFVVGTPYYMSPEQALGQPNLDARADLYAVGAVLFQMVTGTPPFEGETSQEIVAKHLSEQPPLATAVNAKIPRWLSEVIVKLMAKRPADRYQSAQETVRALATGRASGSHEAVSAVRVAAQVQADRTEVIPTGERRAGGGATPTTPLPRPGGRSKTARLVVPVVALLALSGGLGYALSARTGLVLANRLAEPIAVVASGDRERTVAPGEELRVWRVGAEGVRWRLVRPGPAPGRGLELSGVLLRPAGSARRREIGSRAGGEAYFAPLITNNTREPLTVTVNAGLRGSESCCTVPPGATREHVGYYPLFQNSTVRVEDPQGRSAMFQDLGPQVDPVSGTVGLRFETADLRRR